MSMARPLRDTDPSKLHLITVRTAEAALWMIPCRALNDLLGGILARYQEIYSVIIHAFIFTGNHYHMLVRAPYGHLDEFVENVNREVARRVNWRNKRRAKFWGRRYDDQVVLSDDDALEALLYIVTNATKHGLIAHPGDYPGFSCYEQLLDENGRAFDFTHYALSSPGKEIKTSHALTLTPLPKLEALNPKERKKTLLNLINERVKLLRAARAEKNQKFLTAAILRSQTPGTLPRESARSARPLGYSKNPKLIREYKETATWVRRLYTIASFEYRSGNHEVLFPAFTFKPPIHRKPRLVPFGHLAKRVA